MASGLLIDYLGSGVIADRPVSLTLFADTVGLWWATDTTTLSAWDGATWTDIAGGGGSGDVVGPGSSVDNTVVRFDSTTGKLIQGSGVVVSDTDQISGYRVNINKQTGTSYTLQESDRGKVVELNNGSPIALTADPTLDADFACTIVQMGTGVVTVASSGGGAVVNRQSQFDTAGQYATCGIYCTANAGGSAAQFVFYGDTA